MKKRQAIITYILILAFLGGYTGFYLSIRPVTETSNLDTFHFQKTNASETILVFLAEEEIPNEEFIIRKGAAAIGFDFHSRISFNLTFEKDFNLRTLPAQERQKKFLVHLQLLI